MRKLAFVFILLLSACSLLSPPSNYSGQWVGSAVDRIAGAGQVNLTISQSGDELSGSWQIGFSAGANSGSMQGVANGDTVQLQLFPSNPNACPYNLTATRSGDTMNGNYAAFNCTQAVSGTVSVTKQ